MFHVSLLLWFLRLLVRDFFLQAHNIKDWKEDLFLELLNLSSLFCSCGAASTHSKNYHLARHLTLHMTKPCSKHMSASVTSDLSSEETAPLFMQVSRVYASQHKSSCSVAAFAHICTSVHAIAPLISLTSHLQLLPAGQQHYKCFWIIESEQSFLLVLMLQNTCLPLPLATCLQKKSSSYSIHISTDALSVRKGIQ